MITLAELLDHAELAVGSRLDPRLIESKRIVNQAGRTLVQLHIWGWLERPRYLLDIAANQNWIELPLDFGHLVHPGVISTSTTSRYVIVTDLHEVGLLEASPVSNLQTYWVAIERPSQHSTSLAAPRPRLGIYPTPTSSSAGAMELLYRATWLALRDMNAVANVLPEYETLLIEIVRALAIAYTNNTSAFEALDAIKKSESFRAMQEWDGATQTDLGQSLGGIVSVGRPGTWRPHSTISRS